MLKKILTNTLAQLVAKFFGAGLTLLTTYFTIRLAGLDLYGDLTKILVLVAVGFTAIDFGLNAEGIRSSGSKEEMRIATGKILLARLLLSILAILFLNLVILILPGGYSSEVKSTFWLGSLAIIFQGIYTSGNSWFQYNLSYWRSTISVVVGSLVGTILTLYFLKFAPTLSNLVIANTIGYFFMALTSLLFLPKLDELYKLDKLATIFPHLRRSLILGLILIFSILSSKIDTIILGIFRSSSEVGEYGFAYRIFDVILVIPVFVMNVVYPLSIREIVAKSKKSIIDQTSKYLFFIGMCIAIILWYTAPLIYLVKPGLVLTTTVLRLLSLSLPLFYLTAPLMWSLIAKKKDKNVLGVYIVAAVINSAFNLVFIPSYGVTAAAINTGLTELFIFLALIYFTKKFQ